MLRIPRILFPAAVIFLQLTLSGCFLEISPGAGGDIQSQSGANDCSAGSTCRIEITDFTFSEVFTATARPGWKFKRWESHLDGGGDRRCSGSTNPVCALSNIGLAGHPNAEDAIASNQVYFLVPVFELMTGYLGLTSGSYDGATGLLQMSHDCGLDYNGEGAHMCSTKELFESPSASAAFLKNGWIRSSVVAGNSSGAIDYTGREVQEPDCSGGTSAGGRVALSTFGLVDTVSCGATLPAYCCR